MAVYDKQFFEGQSARSNESARVVVPMLRELVGPASVIDLGCGVGGWLAAWREAGVDDVHGFDGDYVDRSMLEIEADRFTATDLTAPLDAGRTFDLAESFEVAEHLPDSSADVFVDSLTSLAPVVAFSAAIPLQGGTHHVNEQWQGYWAAKFRERRFCAVDAIRASIWDDERVAPWYRQNLLLFVQEDRLSDFPALSDARARTDERMLNVVHPWFLSHRNDAPIAPPSQLAMQAARRAVGGLKRRLTGAG